VLPSGQKVTLGLLATINFEVVPFRAYTPFPALLPFFKCILEVMFCSTPPAVLPRSPEFWQNGGLSVLSSVATGQVRQVGWTGDNSHFAFGQKFPGEKVSVRWCIVMMQQPVLLSSKFRVKPSHIFTQSP
jgi:hypothetical protein